MIVRGWGSSSTESFVFLLSSVVHRRGCISDGNTIHNGHNRLFPPKRIGWIRHMSGVLVDSRPACKHVLHMCCAFKNQSQIVAVQGAKFDTQHETGSQHNYVALKVTSMEILLMFKFEGCKSFCWYCFEWLCDKWNTVQNLWGQCKPKKSESPKSIKWYKLQKLQKYLLQYPF